jgi:hypothetical protein
MRKDQFFNKHKNSNLAQAELERKWRVIREQEELQKLWEAEEARQRAMASSISGTGGGVLKNQFYAFSASDSSSGFFNSADLSGNLTPIGSEFNGLTVFCKNQENGLVYYIEQDTITVEMVVGIINPLSGEKTELSRTVLDDYYYTPTSLSYLGNNNFLYLDNSPIFSGVNSDPQHIFILTISNEGAVIISGDAPIATWDILEEGTIITSLFSYNEEIWAFCAPSGYPICLIGKFDPEAGSLNDLNLLMLESTPFSENFKIWLITGCTQSSDGSIYVNATINDKSEDVLYQSILKLDSENFYNSQYVQQINPNYNIFSLSVIDIEII